MAEFKNVTKTGNVYLRLPDGGQSGVAAGVKSVNGLTNSAIDLLVANGTFYKVFTTNPSTATNYDVVFGCCTRVDVGGKATFDMRLSFYEGVYYGPYQTYTANAVVREHRIYYKSSSTTAPTAPTS